MGATAHRHPSAPHIGVLQQYYYIPQPLNLAFPQQQQQEQHSDNTAAKQLPLPTTATTATATTATTTNNNDNSIVAALSSQGQPMGTEMETTPTDEKKVCFTFGGGICQGSYFSCTL